MKKNKFQNYPEIKEYETDFNNDLIKLTVGKTDNNIFIRSSFYGISMTCDDLKQLTQLVLDSLDKAYNYITKISEFTSICRKITQNA